MNKNKVRKLIEAKRAMEESARAFAELKEAFKEQMLAEGIEEIEVDGHKVSIVRTSRRQVDALTLKELVNASIFRHVTEPAVHLKLFDTAVKQGKIDQTVIEQVVTHNEIVQVHVR